MAIEYPALFHIFILWPIIHWLIKAVFRLAVNFGKRPKLQLAIIVLLVVILISTRKR